MNEQALLIALAVIAGTWIAIYIIRDYFKVPFAPPTIEREIDISGRRKPSYEECIDEWLIQLSERTDDLKQELIDYCSQTIGEWDGLYQHYLSRTWFWRGHKRAKYEEMKDLVLSPDYPIFEFLFSRDQTRYCQSNYVRSSYVVQNIEGNLPMSLEELLSINKELSDIGYETTRAKYFSKNQRRLMTPELRQQIKERDNYTCQMCGKYMPDEVGLQIDHIVAIKNGGKTVPSNLQVLCSRCNLSKGARGKIPENVFINRKTLNTTQPKFERYASRQVKQNASSNTWIYVSFILLFITGYIAMATGFMFYNSNKIAQSNTTVQPKAYTESNDLELLSYSDAESLAKEKAEHIGWTISGDKRIIINDQDCWVFSVYNTNGNEINKKIAVDRNTGKVFVYHNNNNTNTATGTSTYNLSDTLTIKLAPTDDGKDHYAVVGVTLSVDTSNGDYDLLKDDEPIIKDEVNKVISSYTYSQIQAMTTADLQEQILKRLQDTYNSQFITGVSFSSWIIQ